MIHALLALATLSAPVVVQDAPPPPPGNPMLRADADGDGIVTRAEVLAEAGRRFDRIDMDHDGRLTAAEMQARMDGRPGFRPGADRTPPPPPPPPPAD